MDRHTMILPSVSLEFLHGSTQIHDSLATVAASTLRGGVDDAHVVPTHVASKLEKAVRIRTPYGFHRVSRVEVSLT
jgi:hypothetical protein